MSAAAGSTQYVAAGALAGFGAALLRAAGLEAADAQTVAEDLVAADLRGIASHGVSRLPMYLGRLRKGLVKPRPEIAVTRVAGAVALVDGDDGMGFLAGHRAMDEAMALAAASGIGLVGVRRSTHYGMAALYPMQAVARGFIAIALTNSSPALPPHGARTAFLGASPLAVGVPGDPPYVLDMAMTVIARGKIRLAAVKGEPIAEGLALDVDGAPTTDAARAFEGVCLPFGGAKGAALAMMMELLAGVLTGASFAGRVKSLYFDQSAPQNVGHLFIALRRDLFLPAEAFDARMAEFTARTKALPRAQGFTEILIPGEPEARSDARHRRTGIPLGAEVLAELAQEAAAAGVPMPPLSPTPLG
ncbi:MAG: Ldh family oxidoreductase [Thalassobaculales bacterium]